MSYFILGPLVATYGQISRADLLRTLLASPGAKLLSPGCRTCEMLRPDFKMARKMMAKLGTVYKDQCLKKGNSLQRGAGGLNPCSYPGDIDFSFLNKALII